MPIRPSTGRSSRRSPTSADATAVQAGAKADKDKLRPLARAGMIAYGVVYLLIAWLALQLAFGDHEGKPSSSGALRELAQQPFGGVLVWLVSIGMFLLAIWQAAEALLGDDGVGTRLARAGKAVLYVVIGCSGVSIALGSGSSGNGEDTWTARLMNVPGGQALVVAVGLVIIGIGAYQGYQAWTDKFAEKLDQEGRSGHTGDALLIAGKVGYAARGVALAVVGGLVVYAGLTHDAKKSGGLDQALVEVLDQPLGPVLLALIALGLAGFGVFTLARSRHLAR